MQNESIIGVKNLDVLLEREEELYLVGGAVRDFLLGREIKDFDFIVSGDVRQLALDFADEIGGSFVVLDNERMMYRVVINGLEYDFSYFSNLEEDLARRDFTINALAVASKNIIDFFVAGDKSVIIDHYGGRKDLAQKIIRQIKDDTFKEDPLRVLRAVRFKAVFNFKIESKTFKEIQNYLKSLDQIAKERIKDELLKIFTASNLAGVIEFFEAELGLFNYLLPEVEAMKQIGKSKYHSQNIWPHSLRAVTILEELLSESALGEEVSTEKIPLLKFALLFHDLGKVNTIRKGDKQISFHGHEKEGATRINRFLGEYHFSNRARKYIVKLIRNHMYPLYLFNASDLSKRGRYRFIRKVGTEVPELLLLSLADVASTREDTDMSDEIKDYKIFLKGLLADYYRFKRQEKDNLLDGGDLMEELDLEEGPQIGQLLNEIAEAYAVGEINTYQGAIDYAKKLLKR